MLLERLWERSATTRRKDILPPRTLWRYGPIGVMPSSPKSPGYWRENPRGDEVMQFNMYHDDEMMM